jgi:hypothetical protein
LNTEKHRKTPKNSKKTDVLSSSDFFGVLQCPSVLDLSYLIEKLKKNNFPYGRGRESQAEAGTGHLTKSLKGLTFSLFRGPLFLPVPCLLRFALLCEA